MQDFEEHEEEQLGVDCVDNPFYKGDVVQLNPDFPHFGACLVLVMKTVMLPVKGKGNDDRDKDSEAFVGLLIAPDDEMLTVLFPSMACRRVGKSPWQINGKIGSAIIDKKDLEKLPNVKMGDIIECKKCGKDHKLESPDKKMPSTNDDVLFYKCEGKIKVGAIEGKLIANMNFFKEEEL